jgi:hypothetical protein
MKLGRLGLLRQVLLQMLLLLPGQTYLLLHEVILLSMMLVCHTRLDTL